MQQVRFFIFLELDKLNMDSQIIITDFEPIHQAGIDHLLAGIQNEYPDTIYGIGKKKIMDVYELPGRKYWVATDLNVVIGSIGVLLLAHNNACLKSMFLQKEYRGGSPQMAYLLLTTATDYAAKHGAKQIILGTIVQFKAAQAFYLKQGFTAIREDDLPTDFVKVIM